MRYTGIHEKGLVMLETAIVMPLHLILFLSVVWLGQLSLDRIRLAEADRAYAFSGTILLDDLYGEEKTYIKLTDDRSEDLKTGVSADSTLWWKASQSRLKLEQELPSWLAGMKLVYQIFFGGTDDPIGSKQVMFSQGESGGTSAVSYQYRRSADVTYRDVTDGDEGAVQSIYAENYIGSDNAGSLSLNDVVAHSRDSKLEEWSVK